MKIRSPRTRRSVSALPSNFRNRFLLATTLVLSGGAALAQTNGTWIGTASANWSATASWQGGAIPDAGGTATFNDLGGQVSGFTATIDTTSRTLSQIVYNTGYSPTIAASGGAVLNMSATGLTLNATYGLQSSPTLFFTTVNDISAVIAGTGDLVKTGSGSVSLSNAANTFTGTVRVNTGGLWVRGGNATLGNVANAIDINGGTLGVNSVALTTARTMNIGAGGGTLQTFFAMTHTGLLTGSGTLTKQIGNAAFTYQGDGTGFTGLVRADGGTVTLSGNGRIGGTAAVEVGSTVALDSSATNFNNRLNGRPITQRGGTLTLTGNATAGTTETAGALTLAQGNAFFTVTPNAAQSSTLSFTSVNRQNNSTMFIRGTNLGAAPGVGVATVLFTTSPGVLIGGGGDPTTSTTASILPWAYGNTVATATNDSTFLTWDAGTLRIIPVSVATGYATNITTAAAQDNVNQNADATLAAPTTVNALRMAPAAATTISGSPLTVTSGAILQTSAAATAPASTISADVTAGSNELVLTSTSGSASTGTGLVLSGVVSGTGGLTRTGNGVVHLLGANTYTGLTSLVGGTTVLGSTTLTADGSAPSAFGQDTSAIVLAQTGGTNRLYTTGSLVINRPINVILGSIGAIGIGTVGLTAGESVTVNGNIAMTNSGATGPNSFLALEGNSTSTSAVTVNGIVSGNGGLRANFGAYSILNGANTYTGGTLVGGTGFQTGTGINAQAVGETWEAGNNSAFGTGPVWVGSTATTVQPLPAFGTLVAGGGARTLNNRFVIVSGLMGFAGSNPITLAGNFELNGGATNTTFLGVGATAPTTISGAVSNGGLVKGGAGTLTLSGTNTYTGETYIRQGVLSVGSIGNGGVPGNLGGAPSGSQYLRLTGNAAGDTGTLRYTGAGESTNRLFTLAGTGGTIDSSGSGPLSFTNTGSTTSSTPIGSGSITGVTLVANAGVISLSTAFASQLVVGSVISGNANIPTGTTITEVGPNWIRLSAPATNAAQATGQAITVTLPASLTQRTLTLTGSNTGTNSIASVITNNTALPTAVVKSGAGTWSLSGANTYAAGTTINAGTLLLNNTTGSATGTGAVTVNSGGTLGGGGTSSGSLTVNSGGTVAPGNSAGRLTVGNTIFTAGSTLAMELNGNTPATGYDQLAVNGTIDAGTAQLLLTLGFVPNVSDNFFLVVNDGADPFSNTFLGLAEGSSVSLLFGGTTYQGTVTYQADSVGGLLTGGNDFALSGLIAIPEPGSLALLGLGALPLAGFLRRRRK